MKAHNTRSWTTAWLSNLGAALCLLAGFATGFTTPVLAAKSTRARTVPPEVLAFYYGWWGNPKVSGSWQHWQPAPDQRHALNVSGTPLDGLYDSHDATEVAHQVAEARQAGINGFIADWWGQNDFTDQSIPDLLAAAHESGFKVTAILDGNLAGNDVVKRKHSAMDDLLYLLRRYADDAAWLRVNGKPVLFIYDRPAVQLSPSVWREVLAEVRAKSPNGLVAIGPKYQPDWLDVFDGADEYNVTGATHSFAMPQLAAWAREHYARQTAAAAAKHKISCVTVIPGYDDSHTGRPAPRPTTERGAGRTYAVLWQAAIAAHPDWVLITSWNEWHEGTEIEPSQEFKGAFLTSTRLFASRFLATASRHNQLGAAR